MAPQQKKAKKVRVRVVRGFLGYVSDDAPEGAEKPEHLPGAVIDLEENFATVEIHRGRVIEVDADTPLQEGEQPETDGKSSEERARDERKRAQREQQHKGKGDKSGEAR